MIKISHAQIPMKCVGPLRFSGDFQKDICVPLATYEKPLWSSVSRGALISRLSNGIKTTVVDERMTRSILFESSDAKTAFLLREKIIRHKAEICQEVEKSSQFAKLIDWSFQQVANLIYIRLEFSTGDAAGHNMVTNAADKIVKYLLQKFSELKYLSISGNFCCDKKVSAVNGILGRGKNTIAEITISRDVCDKRLRTTPELIVELNIKKNLIGSILAGGVCSANAHYANMLLAFFLANGQDAANIVEGSQGITHAEVKNGDLYFSCNLPNLILGTVGNGKELGFVQENLSLMGCTEKSKVGENSRNLARICAGVVLCGELSLMAAQTNIGELMESHLRIERKKC